MTETNENNDSFDAFAAMDAEEQTGKQAGKKKREKKKFFDPENPVTEFLTTAGSLVLINIYFILCSLPIITMGAALTAMNRCCYDLMEFQDVRITKLFFKTFGTNFINATLIWIIGAGILSGAGFGVYWAFSQKASDLVVIVSIVVCLMICLPILMVLAYYFMMIGRYENDIFAHLRNSFLMAFLKPFWTFLILLMWGGIAALLLLVQEVLLYGGWFVLMMGFSLLCFATCHIYKRVISKTAREG